MFTFYFFKNIRRNILYETLYYVHAHVFAFFFPVFGAVHSSHLTSVVFFTTTRTRRQVVLPARDVSPMRWPQTASLKLSFQPLKQEQRIHPREELHSQRRRSGHQDGCSMCSRATTKRLRERDFHPSRPRIGSTSCPRYHSSATVIHFSQWCHFLPSHYFSSHRDPPRRR